MLCTRAGRAPVIAATRLRALDRRAQGLVYARDMVVQNNADPAAQGAATQTPNPSTPHPITGGLSNPSTTGNSSSAATSGAGAPTPQPHAVTYTPEQQADISRREREAADRAAAAARRDEQEASRRDRERAEATARGDVQSLLTAEEDAHRATRAELDRVNLELLALRVALKKRLPNPEVMYLRLRGNTEQELEADADSLLSVLGVAPPQHPTPPVTPTGGGAPVTTTPPASSTDNGQTPNSQTPSRVNVTDDDVAAELRGGTYSGL